MSSWPECPTKMAAVTGLSLILLVTGSTFFTTFMSDLLWQERSSVTCENFLNPWWRLTSTATGSKQQGLSVLLTLMVCNSDVGSWMFWRVLLLHREKDLTEKLEQFRVLLKKLPPENYNNLRWGCTHSSHMVRCQQGRCHIQLSMETSAMLTSLSLAWCCFSPNWNISASVITRLTTVSDDLVTLLSTL